MPAEHYFFSNRDNICNLNISIFKNMLNNFCKSTAVILSGMFLFAMTIIGCNSHKAEKTEENTTIKPADTTPAIDTAHMDSATTRPVKGGN